jgi:hypothetical protein
VGLPLLQGRQDHLQSYLIPTMVVGRQGVRRMLWPCQPNGCGVLDALSDLRGIPRNGGRCPAPEGVQTDSPNTGHDVDVARVVSPWPGLVQLPKNAYVAFERDQQIITVASPPVVRGFGGSRCPAGSYPFLVIFPLVFFISNVKYGGRRGNITPAAPQLLTRSQAGDIVTKICAEDCVRPDPLFQTNVAVADPLRAFWACP